MRLCGDGRKATKALEEVGSVFVDLIRPLITIEDKSDGGSGTNGLLVELSATRGYCQLTSFRGEVQLRWPGRDRPKARGNNDPTNINLDGLSVLNVVLPVALQGHG